MENVINEIKFIKIEQTKEEKNLIKDTQKLLKNYGKDKLPAEMFKSVVSSMAEDKPVVSNLCETVTEYLMKSSIGIGEKVNMFNSFINLLKNEEDCIKVIHVEEDKDNFWIIIKDCSFKNNKKYFRIAREFKKDNKIDFNITLFGEDQISEVEEQLKSYRNYEEF